ncbi:hypothetical protein SUDANB58_05871 (plasmid) [Streptomyces sp. enrichment culture]|uniref:DUF6059 family protein n=1 Tax=Streptomyces sp. enrichment culture TaxID=1795815 RepID=UPI003F5620C0
MTPANPPPAAGSRPAVPAPYLARRLARSAYECLSGFGWLWIGASPHALGTAVADEPSPGRPEHLSGLPLSGLPLSPLERAPERQLTR